jgi:hypothetical protein
VSAAAGYSGTPLPAELPAKLGVTPGCRVLLLGAPHLVLEPLPEGVVLHRRPGRGPYDVALALCADRRALERWWPRLHELVTPAGRLWVGWPKRSSGITTDLDEAAVRDHGLAHGRVDVKVCAVDQAWSALAFVVRVRDR